MKFLKQSMYYSMLCLALVFASCGSDDNGDGDTEKGKTYTVPQAVARWRALLPNAIAIIPIAASEGPDNEGTSTYPVMPRLKFSCFYPSLFA